MLPTLKTMAIRYNRYMTLVGRTRACEVLLASSDRMLDDAGFSRKLLEQGVEAWPWRASDAEQKLPALNLDALPKRNANKILQSCEENEFNRNMGVTHAAGEEVAQNKCTVTDRNTDRQAA